MPEVSLSARSVGYDGNWFDSENPLTIQHFLRLALVEKSSAFTFLNIQPLKTSRPNFSTVDGSIVSHFSAPVECSNLYGVNETYFYLPLSRQLKHIFIKIFLCGLLVRREILSNILPCMYLKVLGSIKRLEESLPMLKSRRNKFNNPVNIKIVIPHKRKDSLSNEHDVIYGRIKELIQFKTKI